MPAKRFNTPDQLSDGLREHIWPRCFRVRSLIVALATRYDKNDSSYAAN